MYLGLDLSLNSTGACLLTDSKTIETRVFNPPNLIGIHRLRYITDELEDWLKQFGGPNVITLAAIENYAMAAHGKTYHIAELGGIVRDRLYTWGIDYIVVGPTQLKLFGTGSGKASKADMGRSIRTKYGVDFAARTWPGFKKSKPKPNNWGELDVHWRNDEADAYMLATVAAVYLNDWDRSASIEQLTIIEQLKLDPQGVLSKSAKLHKFLKDL